MQTEECSATLIEGGNGSFSRTTWMETPDEKDRHWSLALSVRSVTWVVSLPVLCYVHVWVEFVFS